MRSSMFTLGPISGVIAMLFAPLSPAIAGVCSTPSPGLLALGDAYFDIDDNAASLRLSDRRVDNYVDEHGLERISRLGKVNRLAASRDTRAREMREDSEKRVAVNTPVAKVLAELADLDFKEGDGTRLTCLHKSQDDDRSVRRNRDDQTTKNTSFTLTDLQFIHRSSGDYILKAYEEDAEEIISKRIDLPSANRWTHDPSSSSHFTVVEKYRRRNFNHGINQPHSFESLVSDEGISFNPAIANPLVPHASTAGSHLVEVQLSMRVVEDGVELNRVVYINGYWAEELHWNIES